MYLRRQMCLGTTRLQSVLYSTVARRPSEAPVRLMPDTHARLDIDWRDVDAVVLEVLPAKQRRSSFGGDWWNSEPEGTTSEHHQSLAIARSITTTTSISAT